MNTQIQAPPIEGVWSIGFLNNRNEMLSAGVVGFDRQLVFGGNHQYYYTGNYHCRQKQLRATVHVHRYAPIKEAFWPFMALEKFTLHLMGYQQNDQLLLTGYVMEQARKKVVLRLRALSHEAIFCVQKD